MNIKVFSVFSGLGKTYVGNKYQNACDLQSSPYRYDYSSVSKGEYEKIKYEQKYPIHESWPDNYVEALKEAIQNYKVVLVPSNEDIRELLVRNSIPFLFVLPSNDSRQILLERYQSRGNNETFIKSVLDYFDTWSRDQKDYSYPIYILKKEMYLEDLLLELNVLKEGKK